MAKAGRRVKRCALQGKRKFRSPADAHMAIMRAPWALRQRAYRCPHCGFSHLTSQLRKGSPMEDGVAG